MRLHASGIPRIGACTVSELRAIESADGSIVLDAAVRYTRAIRPDRLS
jgi:hypothetical protein